MEMETQLNESQAVLEPIQDISLDVKGMNLEGGNAAMKLFKRLVINPLLNYCLGQRFLACFNFVARNPIVDNLRGGPGSWKSMLAHYDSRSHNLFDN